ncbi:hypothetical protein LRAMOSA11099 [Lichtheimia ramosa]|uniref:Uncharacterized protein n=1 Tax=Lichtheimia ramosa TaxID=688394 RepID=A0A077WUB6_9FUNG|nr:hypothetical protein LRAMOSA11099 [Lichtheimia ramosa]
MQLKIITLLLLVMVLTLSFCDTANAESLAEALKAAATEIRKKLEECPQCKGTPLDRRLSACFKTCDDQKKSVSGGAATTQQSVKSNTKA